MDLIKGSGRNSHMKIRFLCSYVICIICRPLLLCGREKGRAPLEMSFSDPAWKVSVLTHKYNAGVVRWTTHTSSCSLAVLKTL